MSTDLPVPTADTAPAPQAATRAGGHVNHPRQPNSSHRIRHWKHLDRLLTPDEWLEQTEPEPGSWWTPWLEWLRRHSSGLEALPVALPSLGKAPGTYVLQK